jgi:hypothetical protein
MGKTVSVLAGIQPSSAMWRAVSSRCFSRRRWKARIRLYRTDEPISRFKTHLFFLGAALRLAQTHGLTDHDFMRMAMDYLVGVGLDREASAAIMSSFPSLIQDPELTQAVGEGIETLSLWHRSRDVNAPLRLAQLIHEWETA